GNRLPLELQRAGRDRAGSCRRAVSSVVARGSRAAGEYRCDRRGAAQHPRAHCHGRESFLQAGLPTPDPRCRPSCACARRTEDRAVGRPEAGRSGRNALRHHHLAQHQQPDWNDGRRTPVRSRAQCARARMARGQCAFLRRTGEGIRRSHDPQREDQGACLSGPRDRARRTSGVQIPQTGRGVFRMSQWDPALYQSSHSFVWERGRGLIELLAPRAGERILDAGCGTGQLTAEIAKAGAQVLGIDNSAAMIEQARTNFPELSFAQSDVRSIELLEEFDGVFSNAVLHWVKEADEAAEALSRALKPGGRLVVEFGGHGNTQALLDALFAAQDKLGRERFHPWYYPGIAEYASVLERHGLEVRFATLFDRPIAL